MIQQPPDPRPRRRLLLAFAAAIALHGIAIGAAGFLRIDREPPERQATVSRVVLEMRAPPLPTPEPPPRATPPPVATPSTRREVAAPKAVAVVRTQQSGSSDGGPRLVVRDPQVAQQESVPVRAATSGSQEAAEIGSGTAPTDVPSGGSGQGTGNGNGPGTVSGDGGGNGGNGSGPVNADVPCGEPVFYGMHAEYNRADGSFDERVRVQLQLENGQKIAGDFHYPWHYPSEEKNPFSPRWNGDPAIPAQLPPPGYDVSKEPPAVQLTLKYTLPNGLTRFVPCP